MFQQDNSPRGILERGLTNSRLEEEFFALIMVPSYSLMDGSSVIIWGMPIPEDLSKDITTDQGFEDWKVSLGMIELLPSVKLISVRHGYHVMSCDSCSANWHRDPIIEPNRSTMPRHMVRTDFLSGKLPGEEEEGKFVLLTLSGGVFKVHIEPSLTAGDMRDGVTFIQPKPFQS